MKLTLLFLSRISILALSYLFAAVAVVQAQVTPDNTVGTTVEQSGNVSRINNGTVRGGNLFHSFQDFSVPTGNEAHFNNADNIERVFSRVTGGNISNIDGLIRANGSADLYLINPAGIILGENARLDVGGSFLGSTADSILFPEDVAFSASDTQTQPVLTINAPIGLGFRDNPGDITVRAGESNSTEILDNFTGLSVAAGDITLVGGDLSFDGGNLLAIDGNVRLASLDAATIVTLNEDGSLTFDDDIARGNISLINSSTVTTSSVNSPGGVYVDAKNLKILSGGKLNALVGAESNNGNDLTTANVVVDATESVSIAGTQPNYSSIFIESSKNESTNSGIDIQASNLFLNKGGEILATGGADIIINATESVAIDSAELEFISKIENLVDIDGTADSGDIKINSTNFSITNSYIRGGTLGRGNGGAIDINAAESVLIERSFVVNNVEPGAIGNTQGINIQAANLSLQDSEISNSTSGQGNAGAVVLNIADSILLDTSQIFNVVETQAVGNTSGIEITTSSLSLNDGSGLVTNVQGRGIGGNIDIKATNFISFDESAIYNQLPIREAIGEVGDVNLVTKNFISNQSLFDSSTIGQGNSGDISISADSISLTNASQLITSKSNTAQGSAGNIHLQATKTLTIDRSYVYSQIAPFSNKSNAYVNGEGDAGNITIQTEDLLLINGGSINTSTFGSGNAGNVAIEATGKVSIEGRSDETQFLVITFINTAVTGTVNFSTFVSSVVPEIDERTIDENPSRIFSQVGIVEGESDNFVAEGEAGNVEIVADSLTISDRGFISVSSLGDGNSGNIDVQANNITLDEGFVAATYQPEDFDDSDGASNFGGNVSLEIADSLVLQDQSLISATAENNASGGNIDIDAGVVIAYPDGNNDIIANAAAGQGGNIDIDANTVVGIEESPRNSLTNEINASSQVQGMNGNVSVTVLNPNPFRRTTELPSQIIVPEKTSEQACQSDRQLAAKNGLTIEGKGGIPPTPDLPLDSQVIYLQGNSESIASTSPAQNTIKTAKGNIVPARGVEVQDGEIILTSHPTGDISGVGADFINCKV